MPRIKGGNPGGAAQNPELLACERLTRRIHEQLDTWILTRVHDHLAAFLEIGADPGQLVGLTIAPDLRQLMVAAWTDWRESFDDDPALLNRFLRLMVCANEDDGEINAAQVLVGPNRLHAIIRGTAVSLAIASSWQPTTPRRATPGNLLRSRQGEPEWSGYSCAADRINGKATPLFAGRHMWRTHFVILTVEGTVELAQRADRPFAEIASGQPAFSETSGSGPMLMSISHAFSDAIEAGVEALAAMLADLERQHLARWATAIQKRGS